VKSKLHGFLEENYHVPLQLRLLQVIWTVRSVIWCW